MTIILVLVPITVAMGLIGLFAFGWSLRDGQYDDPVGDAERILVQDEDRPL
jgi:cbb3-type cytochrome oxidase maturation protein